MGSLRFIALVSLATAQTTPQNYEKEDPIEIRPGELPQEGTAEPDRLDGRNPPIDPFYYRDLREPVLAAKAGDLFQDLLTEGYAPLLWNTNSKGSTWAETCSHVRLDQSTRGEAGVEFPDAYDWREAAQRTPPPQPSTDPEEQSPGVDSPVLYVPDHELCLSTHLDPEVPMIVRVTASGHVETYFKLDHPSEVATPFPPRRLPLLLPTGALLDALVDAAGCAGVGASYASATLAAEVCGRAEGLRGPINDILAQHAADHRR